jgi:hypothetical protein
MFNSYVSLPLRTGSHDPFIVDLPINRGEFPWLLLVCWREAILWWMAWMFLLARVVMIEEAKSKYLGPTGSLETTTYYSRQWLSGAPPNVPTGSRLAVLERSSSLHFANPNWRKWSVMSQVSCSCLMGLGIYKGHYMLTLPLLHHFDSLSLAWQETCFQYWDSAWLSFQSLFTG